MQRRGGLALAMAAVFVLAGTVGSAGAVPTLDRGASGVAAPGNEVELAELCESGPPDPETDVIGWEAGCWHNQSIAVDQRDEDGLSDAERRAYVARSMARVEYLRDREFEEPVPVEVIPRSEYRNQTENQTRGGNYSAWNNQVWEALFIVGGDEDVQEELETVFGTSVVGFYSPGDDEIKIITETPDEPVLDNATLVHELVHALQDQYYNLSKPQYQGTTQDGQLAADGLVEGEANYIEAEYADRCGAEWECVASPSRGDVTPGPQPNLGILLTVLNPYSDGPVYLDSLLSRGGWAAVDNAYEDPPSSTEQIIHRTADEPVPIEYEDTARNGWHPFPHQGVNGSDTAGEASMYAMFWYQARQYGANTIDPNSLFRDIDGRYDTYNYDAPPSAGWGNDRVFPYRRQVDNETRYGYVWVTEWDTARDAEEFRATYRYILAAHDAEQVGERTWVIEGGPFADSFRVVLNGTRVTVVNAPTVDALADLRPGLEHRPLQTPTRTTERSTTRPSPRGGESPTPTAPTPTAPTTSAPGQPGFGVPAALVALGILALWRRRR